MGDARNRLRKYPRLQNLMTGAGVLSCGQTLAKKHIDLATRQLEVKQLRQSFWVFQGVFDCACFTVCQTLLTNHNVGKK